MGKANCEYYLNNENDDNCVFEHDYLGPCCALLLCKNADGKFLVENSYVGVCKTNRVIESRNPVDKNGKVIDFKSDLELEILEEQVDFKENQKVRIIGVG